ncbi:MAG: hypothetical protein V4510_09345 [bacterium]
MRVAVVAIVVLLAGCSAPLRLRIDVHDSYGGTTTINGDVRYNPTGHQQDYTASCGGTGHLKVGLSEYHLGGAAFVAKDAGGIVLAEIHLNQVDSQERDISGGAGMWLVHVGLDRFNGAFDLQLSC